MERLGRQLKHLLGALVDDLYFTRDCSDEVRKLIDEKKVSIGRLSSPSQEVGGISEIQSLQMEMKALVEDQDFLESMVGRLSSRCDEIKHLMESFSNGRSRCDAMQSELTNMRERLSDISHRLKSKEAHREDIETEFMKLQVSSTTTLSPESQSVESTKIDLDREILSLKEEMKTLENIINRWEESLQNQNALLQMTENQMLMQMKMSGEFPKALDELTSYNIS